MTRISLLLVRAQGTVHQDKGLKTKIIPLTGNLTLVARSTQHIMPIVTFIANENNRHRTPSGGAWTI